VVFPPTFCLEKACRIKGRVICDVFLIISGMRKACRIKGCAFCDVFSEISDMKKACRIKGCAFCDVLSDISDMKKACRNKEYGKEIESYLANSRSMAGRVFALPAIFSS
jgi:hypothetical protein